MRLPDIAAATEHLFPDVYESQALPPLKVKFGTLKGKWKGEGGDLEVPCSPSISSSPFPPPLLPTPFSLLQLKLVQVPWENRDPFCVGRGGKDSSLGCAECVGTGGRDLPFSSG